VIGFGSSANLAAAYGVAVTVTITVDTVLFLVVARKLWRSPSWLVGIGAVVFLTVDIAFLAANANKLFHGGWFPVAIGGLIFVVLSTWKRGNEVLEQSRLEREGTLVQFVEEVRPLAPPSERPQGATVYLNPRIEATGTGSRSTTSATSTTASPT
jgi:KUP system potassium uptake protein